MSSYFEFFGEDDADAAFERFEEIGAATEPERALTRICRLVIARDWDALGECYADDHVLIDHRVLGWEPLRGPDAMVDMFRSWVEARAGPRGVGSRCWRATTSTSAVRYGTRGHAAEGGGAMEVVVIAVGRVSDGRETSCRAVRGRRRGGGAGALRGAPSRRLCRRRRSATPRELMPSAI